MKAVTGSTSYPGSFFGKDHSMGKTLVSAGHSLVPRRSNCFFLREILLRVGRGMSLGWSRDAQNLGNNTNNRLGWCSGDAIVILCEEWKNLKK